LPLPLLLLLLLLSLIRHTKMGSELNHQAANEGLDESQASR